MAFLHYRDAAFQIQRAAQVLRCDSHAIDPDRAGFQPRQTVEFLDSGIKLIFRPFISSDGSIRMELAPSVSEAKIAALPAWQTAEVFEPKERLVLAYADRLVCHGGRVPDALFAEVKAVFSDEEVLELTYITCLYHMHAIMSRALRKPHDRLKRDMSTAVFEFISPALKDHSRLGQSRLLHAHHFGLITIRFCLILDRRLHLNHA